MSVCLKAAVSKPVQEPKKHHYLPEFYLSAWCGADGRLERYVNRNGSIKTRRFATGQVGYREDLYRLLSANIPDRTALERHHLTPQHRSLPGSIVIGRRYQTRPTSKRWHGSSFRCRHVTRGASLQAARSRGRRMGWSLAMPTLARRSVRRRTERSGRCSKPAIRTSSPTRHLSK